MEDYGSKRKPKPRTWNNNLQTLKTCFAYLLEKEYVQVNPFAKINKIPEPETEIIAFSEEELTLIRNRLPNYNNNSSFALLKSYN
jgi:site-specific recombinase XerD